MTTFVAFNKSTWLRIKNRAGASTFPSQGIAERVLRNALKREHGDDWKQFEAFYEVTTVSDWCASEPMTTTHNLLDPDKKPILIRLSEKGGCTDPATERYHSM